MACRVCRADESLQLFVPGVDDLRIRWSRARMVRLRRWVCPCIGIELRAVKLMGFMSKIQLHHLHAFARLRDNQRTVPGGLGKLATT